MSEYMTRDYIVTQDQESGKIEIWLDWVASVDSNPHSPVWARIENQDLLIIPFVGKDKDKKTRRIVGLKKEIMDCLGQGIVLRFCGSSGIIAQHDMRVEG